jgi:hypothetical protein
VVVPLDDEPYSGERDEQASRDEVRERARLREVGVYESDQSHHRDGKRDRELRNVDEVLVYFAQHTCGSEHDDDRADRQ